MIDNRVGGKYKLITAAPTLKLKQFLVVAQEVYNIGLDYARWKKRLLVSEIIFSQHTVNWNDVKRVTRLLVPRWKPRSWDYFLINFNARNMSYLGPIFPILILEFWFQQWTRLDAEEREGGWKPSTGKDWSFSQQLVSVF